MTTQLRVLANGQVVHEASYRLNKGHQTISIPLDGRRSRLHALHRADRSAAGSACIKTMNWRPSRRCWASRRFWSSSLPAGTPLPNDETRPDEAAALIRALASRQLQPRNGAARRTALGCGDVVRLCFGGAGRCARARIFDTADGGAAQLRARSGRRSRDDRRTHQLRRGRLLQNPARRCAARRDADQRSAAPSVSWRWCSSSIIPAAWARPAAARRNWNWRRKPQRDRWNCSCRTIAWA